MNGQITNEKFNITLIINVRELSYLLTGSSRTIRKDFVPKQYREDVKLLTDAVEAWNAARMARVKQTADIVLCEPAENETEQTNTREEIIQAKEIEFLPVVRGNIDHAAFKRVSNNLYANGKCFMAKRYVDGKFIERFFLTKTEAERYLSGNMSGKTE